MSFQRFVHCPTKPVHSTPTADTHLKAVVGVIAPFLSSLFNKSLLNGCVIPDSFKVAYIHIAPLITKSGEEVCFAATASSCRAQSAVSMLMICLRWLSAAFDTVDHHILLQERSYGISGLARQWFPSYLVGRRQFVRTGSYTSSPALILCGVYHRGQSLDRSCSCCTLLTCYCLLRTMVSALICMQMTPKSMGSVGRLQRCMELQNSISTCIDDVARRTRSNRLADVSVGSRVSIKDCL